MNAPCGKTSPAASIDPALKRFAGACVLALGACAAPQGAVERQVVLLAEAPQRPYEEIARILDMNYQSARNLLTRAISALRKEMLPMVIILLILL